VRDWTTATHNKSSTLSSHITIQIMNSILCTTNTYAKQESCAIAKEGAQCHMLDGWMDGAVFYVPRQHSIGYTGDGFYRSKDPTNSIKVLKEHTNNTKIQ